MKKSLLTLGAALLLSASAFAQNTCNTTTDAGNGFAVTDNFASDAGPAGVFYWGNNSKAEATSFSFARNTTSGTLDITVDHLEGGMWSPMGLDINFAEEGKEAVYLDGEDGKISTSITNPGDQAIEIYFAALSNGKTGSAAQAVTASRDGDNISLWGGVIAAGETVEWTFDLATAVKRTYVADQAACDAIDTDNELIGNNCITDAGFDVDNISGLEFSVNGAASAETSWANSLLEDYDVTIDYLVVSECTSFNKIIGAEVPQISEVSNDSETNTFTLSVEPVDNFDIDGVFLSAVSPDAADTMEYLIVVDPTTVGEEDKKDYDGVLEGTFSNTDISFVLDPSGLAEGEWQFIIILVDEEGEINEPDVFTFENSTTALTDAEIANLNAKVFPNPANDVVNVSYNVPADESVVVTLSNSLGQEVASVEGNSSAASIDVADLNGGLYFASIVVDGVVVATQRVVIQ